MKTVFHFVNIGKAFLLCVLVGWVISLFNLPENIEIIIGFIGGVLSMILSLSKWEMWHFE